MNLFMHRALNRFHRGVLALSRGRIGWKLGSMPVVELHTSGRATGERRSVMLTAPLHDGDRYVLVASRGGYPRHPQWYLNLVEDPDVEMTVRGWTVPMRAHTATARERADLWPSIVAAYPGYARYQQKTTREIPVVICEPRMPEGDDSDDGHSP